MQIFRKPLVPNLAEAECVFYDFECMFYLSAHRGLAMLNLPFPVECVVRYLWETLRTAVDAEVDPAQVLIIFDLITLFNSAVTIITICKFIVLPQ